MSAQQDNSEPESGVDRTGEQAGGTKADVAKTGGAKADGTKADVAKTGGAKADGTKAGGAKAGGTKAGGSKAGLTKTGGTKAGATKAGATADRAGKPVASTTDANAGSPEHVSAGTLALSLFAYTFARLLLVAAVAAIIMGLGVLVDVTVPFYVAAVFGVLIALPLGMVLFKRLRLRVNRQIAAVEAERRGRHDDLQARLRGDKK